MDIVDWRIDQFANPLLGQR